MGCLRYVYLGDWCVSKDVRVEVNGTRYEETDDRGNGKVRSRQV